MLKATVRVLVLALLAIAVVETTADAQQRTRQDPNRITVEEIEAVTANNAYDLVQRLRPTWFRVRGTTSLQQRTVDSPMGGTMNAPISRDVVVYLDGSRFGPHGSLRNLPLEAVVGLEYIDGPSATNRFGTGHPYGAILITTRR